MRVKTYCSHIKTFCNDKRIPIIPPLLIDNKFVIDIQTKVNIFNKFFAKEYIPPKNDSVLPKSQAYLTQWRLCFLDLNKDEILKIIRALNIKKAHGHDDISNKLIEFVTNPYWNH